GLLRDVGRGLRTPVLLGPRGAARARRSAALPTRRVHRRGALHTPLGAVLPPEARARGRRARGAPDGLLPARREVRLRGAAPARAPEPDARAPGLRRGADPDGRARRGAGPGLLPGDGRKAGEARGGDLQGPHRQVPLLVDLARRGTRADARSVRAFRRQRLLVRRRT